MVPTVKRDVRHTIAEPAELAGREVVTVDADACGFRFRSNVSCGLVRNHRGECWECSDELIAQAGGAFALLAVAKADETFTVHVKPEIDDASFSRAAAVLDGIRQSKADED